MDEESRPALQEPEFPPNPQPGQFLQLSDNIYCFVEIQGGAKGGRWAYWTNADLKHHYSVIVDILFALNGKLAGSLISNWNGVDSTCWVKVKGWTPPIPDEKVFIEPIEKAEGRYERNDVDRITEGPKED